METVDKPRPIFVAKMAYIMSLMALSIDAILPAVNQITQGLSVESSSQAQLIISIVFMGMSVGFLIGGTIATFFKASVLPLVLGFFVASLLSLLIIKWSESKNILKA